MGNVTLQTIADEVGVSRTTVSNAFSRPDQLSTELRDRIHEVADRLGYGGPDPLARRLRTGRAGAIGVVLTETLGYTLRDPYAGAFLAGVAEEVGADTTGLLLLPLPPGGEDWSAVRNAMVDGFVVSILPDGHPAIEVLRGRGLPLVTVDGPCIDGVSFVAADDRAAARELASLVVEEGHRDILVLTFRASPDDHVGVVTDERLERARYRVTRERLRGLREVLDEADVPRDSVRIHEVGENRPDAAGAAIARAMSDPRPPTAVVCLSDRLALDALRVLEGEGVRVPQDVSVTGWDDISPAAAAGLTTVRQHADAKGRHAVRLLFDGQDARHVVVPHTIVRRRTLAAAPV